jgi:hypothetical protein
LGARDSQGVSMLPIFGLGFSILTIGFILGYGVRAGISYRRRIEARRFRF